MREMAADTIMTRKSKQPRVCSVFHNDLYSYRGVFIAQRLTYPLAKIPIMPLTAPNTEYSVGSSVILNIQTINGLQLAQHAGPSLAPDPSLPDAFDQGFRSGPSPSESATPPSLGFHSSLYLRFGPFTIEQDGGRQLRRWTGSSSR